MYSKLKWKNNIVVLQYKLKKQNKTTAPLKREKIRKKERASTGTKRQTAAYSEWPSLLKVL